MRGKYAVIGLLLAGLGLLVWWLVRLERGRARPRYVRVVEPAPGPVEITATREEIEAAAAEAGVRFRCAGEEFEHLVVSSNARGEKTEAWQKLFIVGANLGVALPGRYPTEFAARREDYARWLGQMAEAGINAVRVYTILPPEFYQALAGHNFRNSERPVFLLQGIWAELPESNDLFDADYTRALKQEIRDAVDVVAGRAVRPERPGHAAGVYSADVSAFTLGYLFGREWEPEAVAATDSARGNIGRYEGVFFSVPAGSPTEVWLAGMLDYLVQYEVLAGRVQRPVAFTSWLPIDPLHHPSEYADRWRAYEADNDLVAVDPLALHTTPAHRAGYFAAYHVYPYYPDFVFLDPAYRDYRNARGEPDNYAGYLHELKRHHAGLPLLVAEFGVPSSRGSSHHSWLGMNHGGHDEEEQARMNLAMLGAIHAEGCAGGVVFAWLDEWFKRNWLIDDFAVPADRVRLWHNVQNPEQCFGMVRFGRELVAVDGNVGDWTGRPLAAARDPGAGIRALWAAADEEYCYLRLDLAQAPDWRRHAVGIAIDTYDPRLGNMRLGRFGLDCANGVEFLVLLSDTGDAEVLVDSGYSLYYDPQLADPPAARTVAGRDGAFVTQRLISNHLRLTAAGETIPTYTTEYGRLGFGRSADNSLADWYARDRVIELRLPWALLNVSDPSSFQVLQDDPLADGIQSATTPGFAFSAFIADKATPGAIAALPAARGGVLQFTRRWRWRGWEQPAYEERLKQSYDIFAAGLVPALSDSASRRASLARLAAARADAGRNLTARLARFEGDRAGAVSFTFDDGSYDQLTHAVPVLGRYGMKAGFGLVAAWTEAQPGWHAEADGVPFLRLGVTEAKRLLADGHTIAAHGLTHAPELAGLPDQLPAAASALEQALGAPVRTCHYPYSAAGPELVRAARRSGFWFGRATGDRHNPASGFDRFRLSSFAFYNETLPGLDEFIRILAAGREKWTILQHHHILEPDARELQTMLRHNVLHTYSVTPLTFARQARLVRNAGLWVAPIEDVGRYLLQHRRARLVLGRSERSATLRLEGAGTEGLPAVPMTAVLDVPWQWVTVTGSLADGIYSPYNGRLVLPLLPDRDVILSRPEEPDFP
jgi:peptidoglycan/xylan/chitin deacetylase (PgdA/CDA1 family)